MNVLEKAQQALNHHTELNSITMEDCSIFIDGHDGTMYELAHGAGQFKLSEFRALVNGYEELKHRMDGLEK